MLIINNEIDLGKSFERLKDQLHESFTNIKRDKPESFALELGRLQVAITHHILKCTDIPESELLPPKQN